MRDQTVRRRAQLFRLLAGVAILAVALPGAAQAQYSAPSMSERAIGESYHVEFGYTFWNPNVTGTISSAQFGIRGDSIDFISDLGFVKTRFKDLRIVVRPSKKSRFRIQHTPVQYTSEPVLHRTLVFNGLNFPVSVPTKASFGWNVWRFGYEYDFVYGPHGFVGVLLEGRYTDFTASLDAPTLVQKEFTQAKAPLPAIGVVARGYVAPGIAVNFELSGFKVPDVPKYKANYFDWDIYGTINLTNNVGAQVGWRRMTTTLNIEEDMGDFKFQGLWFGGVVRY